MTDPDRPWAIGIEEEYLLVDRSQPEHLLQASHRVLEEVARRFGDEIDPELLQSQVEVATGVHDTLESAGAELASFRAKVGEAAAASGASLMAAGCHPTARWSDQQVTDKERYHLLAEGMAQVARETVVCGLHVHVGVPDPAARIRAINGARRWLGPILALSASSPHWHGHDTGFASYRTPVFRRWPMTGIPDTLAGWADFEDLVAALVAAGIVADGTNLYWDLRPSVRFPTVEVRVADACPRLADTLTIAALIRAVIRTAADPATPAHEHPGGRAAGRHEVLEAAIRSAARTGLAGELVHPGTGVRAPAAEVVAALVEWCRPALEAAGDADRVDEGVGRILADGGAAGRIRRSFDDGGYGAAIDLLVTETAAPLS